jgi:hypothetical protein
VTLYHLVSVRNICDLFQNQAYPEVAPLKEEYSVVKNGHFCASDFMLLDDDDDKSELLTEAPRPLALSFPLGNDIAPHSPTLASLISPSLNMGVP